MSFSLSVRRLTDPPAPAPPDSDDPADPDLWLSACAAGELYAEPLGAGGTVYRWWHVPAHQLGLPLLRRIYPDGLVVSGGDLDGLASELDALEAHWRGSTWEQEPPLPWSAHDEGGGTTEGHIPFRDHLLERLGYLRHAIAIARRNAGVVSIDWPIPLRRDRPAAFAGRKTRGGAAGLCWRRMR